MKCPACGHPLKENNGTYAFAMPDGGTIVIDGAQWWSCDGCGIVILSHELDIAIDEAVRQAS